MTIGEITRTRVFELRESLPAAALSLAPLMDKAAVATTIRDRLRQLAAMGTRHTLTTLELEEARDRSSPPRAGLDGVLSLRVVDISLENERGGDAVALTMHLWVHLDQATFMAFDYKGRAKSLDAWAADDARLLRHEIERAARDIAGQIADALFAGAPS
jgi:hypothetical protein